jgi:hypothetical protein
MLVGVTGFRESFSYLLTLKLHTILFVTLSLGTLSLSLQLTTNGQPIKRQQNNRSELHGGIEIGSKSIKAIVIQIAESSGRVNIVSTEVINNKLALYKDRNLTDEAITNIAQLIDTLYKRMQQEQQILSEQIHIIICSDLTADNIGELTKTITAKTGKNVTLLDMQSEASLSIAGTIPRRYQDRATWFDNRGMSVLIDVGSGNIKGGYQQIRILPKGKPENVFFTFGIPQGTMRFSDDVEKEAGAGSDIKKFAGHARIMSDKSVREPLQRELERRPGLINRKKVYLNGGIVWAMVTLLYPQDRQPLVPITTRDIDNFYTRTVIDPEGLLRPNLSQIRSKQARMEAENDLAVLKSTFTPEDLVAGAEILRNVAIVFNLGKDREILFARFSNLSLLLSYIRVQADNGRPQP